MGLVDNEIHGEKRIIVERERERWGGGEGGGEVGKEEGGREGDG